MPFGSRIGPTLAAFVFFAFATLAAERAVADSLPIGDTALPGGEHVASAQRPSPMAAIVGVGYGHTERVAGSPAVHERAVGKVGLSFSPFPALMIGATGFSRIDAHYDGGKRLDEGAAFGSALAARYRHELSQTLALGADLTVLFPPANGIARGFSATSPSLRAIGTYALPHAAHLSLNAGARLDRSRYAVNDPQQLSADDRVAAGLSASNAVLLGAMLSVPLAGFVWTGEWSWDLGVGSAAPTALASPMRVEASVQRPFAGSLFAGALLGVSPSSRPRASELSRIEPRVWASLTLGWFLDPVRQATARSPAGPVESKAAAPAPAQASATAPAAATEPALSLPPGQIRGRVRSLRGKALRARVEVLPLGQKLETDAKGAFVVDVPPGSYKVLVHAEGHETQERPAEVEENGVTILVIDLRRSKP